MTRSSASLLQHLGRIEGQVRGLQQMIQHDRYSSPSICGNSVTLQAAVQR